MAARHLSVTASTRLAGQFHGFFTMGKLLNQANVAVSEIATRLKALGYGAHSRPAMPAFKGAGR